MLQRGLDARPFQILRGVARVLDDLNDVPPAPLALRANRGLLRVHPGTAVCLLLGTHPHIRYDAHRDSPCRVTTPDDAPCRARQTRQSSCAGRTSPASWPLAARASASVPAETASDHCASPC